MRGSGSGWLAQLGEHLPYKQRVGGSIPSPPTNTATVWVPKEMRRVTCRSYLER